VPVFAGRPGKGEVNCGAHTGPGGMFSHGFAGILNTWSRSKLNGALNPFASAMAS